MFHKMFKTAVLSAGLILGTAHAAFAASYAETGDAGDLVTGAAQMVTGTAGATISSITGTLTKTAGISEADVFQIYISSPSTFSASTSAFAPGANNFDSQLFLFTLGGKGIVMNDDDPAGGSTSNIYAGNSFTSSLTAGYYYLMVAGSSQNPTSAGGLIFPSWTDGSTDPSGLYGPNAGASAITSFAGSSNEGGAYSIALTGVTIIAAAVPEPSAVCLGLAGGLMLLGLSRRRHGKTSVQ